MNVKLLSIAVVLSTLPALPVYAGPLAYALCQTGCNAVVVACYGAAGAVFGTVTAGVAVAPAILACNAALGTCSAACAATALIAPTP
ncbi:hypothetical protein C8Q76DRAFT_789410 [Earliella scabrosa]|nr:hypothetical protein C8Q76DRAFT_789410 [Earliella scabrosa]